jgi:hypothetical protein
MKALNALKTVAASIPFLLSCGEPPKPKTAVDQVVVDINYGAKATRVIQPLPPQEEHLSGKQAPGFMRSMVDSAGPAFCLDENMNPKPCPGEDQ